MHLFKIHLEMNIYLDDTSHEITNAPSIYIGR